MSETSKIHSVKFGNYRKSVHKKYLKDIKIPPALSEYLAPVSLCLAWRTLEQLLIQ